VLNFAESVFLAEIAVIENVAQEYVERLSSRAPIPCANRQSVLKFVCFSVERIPEAYSRLRLEAPKVESLQEFACVRDDVGCSLITKRGSADSNGCYTCLNPL